MKMAVTALIFISLSLGACTNSNKKPGPKKQYKYYCIMHPNEGSDKPGVCAKCGMQLVERDTDK